MRQGEETPLLDKARIPSAILRGRFSSRPSLCFEEMQLSQGEIRREDTMERKNILRFSLVLLLAFLCAGMMAKVGAQQAKASGGVQVKAADIGGVVTSSKGPEAGVWVIAETTDLPTKYVKIVVTDDAGRYLIPDLPTASYQVWVRGYGLVDSTPVDAKPGASINLKA